MNVFARKLHHRNASIIFMVQNFFSKNKHMRTISLNAQYIMLFKNPCNNIQFAHLAKLVYPLNSCCVQNAYADTTRELYGYMLLDLRSEQDEDLKLRMPIFPTNDRLCMCENNVMKSLKLTFSPKMCQLEQI